MSQFTTTLIAVNLAYDHGIFHMVGSTAFFREKGLSPVGAEIPVRRLAAINNGRLGDPDLTVYSSSPW